MKAKQNAMTLFNCGCIHFCIKTAANHDKTAVDLQSNCSFTVSSNYRKTTVNGSVILGGTVGWVKLITNR